MNTRTTILPMLFALGVCTAACSSQGGPGGGEPAGATGSTQQNIISATGNVMMWPAGPIVWDGLVGTWPIAVWSPVAIGGLAFDVAGVTNLAITTTSAASLNAIAITDPYLTAWTASAATPWLGAGAPLLGTAGLLAPAYGFPGAFDPAFVGTYGFGAGAAGFGAYSASYSAGAIYPGFWAGFTPMLTSSALMFNDLMPLTTMMPYTFNLTFTAAAQAQAAASLSIFATTTTAAAITASTIPYTSMIYPIMMPFTAPLVAPIAPAVVAPAVVAPAVVAPVVARPGLL